MKKLILIMLVAILAVGASQNAKAQQNGQRRVYAELLGTATNLFGVNKNVKVSVDMGQYQSAFKSYTLQDENGNDIKFSSMVEAMNYMGERGWMFVQTYVVSKGKDLVYHWLLYKDVNDASEIMEGLNVKNMDN